MEVGLGGGIRVPARKKKTRALPTISLFLRGHSIEEGSSAGAELQVPDRELDPPELWTVGMQCQPSVLLGCGN